MTQQDDITQRVLTAEHHLNELMRLTQPWPNATIPCATVRSHVEQALSKLRAPVADERDRNATISKVVGMCNRIPGATTWNAAEFMYDEMHRRAALAVAGERSAVAYLDLGAGGYMDVGTDLTDEQLAALPKGRHMLAIIGTHGVNGYAPASAPVADERAAFEAWATAIAEKYDVTRNGDHYMEPYTEWVWEAWQERARRAALASAPVAGEAKNYPGDNVAERLDKMADGQPPGSQAQSDLYAAATIWRKHIAHRAAPQASAALRTFSALEEAAHLMEQTGKRIAASDIRALKTQADKDGGGDA